MLCSVVASNPSELSFAGGLARGLSMGEQGQFGKCKSVRLQTETELRLPCPPCTLHPLLFLHAHPSAHLVI